MKPLVTCVALLLCCVSVAAQTEKDWSDIENVMKELGTVQESLRAMEVRLKDDEAQIAEITGVNQRHATTMKTLFAQLNSTGKQIIELSTSSKAHTEQLKGLDARLNHTDEEVEKLKKIASGGVHSIESLNNMLNISVKKMDELTSSCKNHSKTLTALTTKMAKTDKRMTLVHQQTSAVSVKMAVNDAVVKRLNKEIRDQLSTVGILDIRTKVNKHSIHLENLRKLKPWSTKVAFTVTLTGNYLSSSGGTPDILIYKNIITNIGKAYSPDTGFFRAPVKGIYLFSFTAHASATQPSHVILFRNSMPVVSINDHKSYSGSNSEAGFVILKLKAGDRVYIKLNNHAHIWNGPQSSFSGMLH